MSVKVLSVNFQGQRLNCTAGVPHIFQEDASVFVQVALNDTPVIFDFRIRAGFKTDGASVPWAFRWFLPSWADAKNPFKADIYNLGAAIHDGLYIHKGFGIFTREECDDILRGIWREAGIGRFRAGVADKCIEYFAGGDNHWGNDSYGVGSLISMEF